MKRDQDGFIQLRWLGSSEESHSSGIGENRIIRGIVAKQTSGKSSSSRYRESTKSENTYVIDYAPKTWQFKAWRILSKKMPFGNLPKSQFKECRGNRKLRRISRIGIMMKVRTDDYGNSKTILDNLAKDELYAIADTPKEFEKIINRMQYMLLDLKPEYKKQAIKLDSDYIAYLSKMFVIYDDMTYDAICGNPYMIFEHLGLKFDSKGKVIL